MSQTADDPVAERRKALLQSVLQTLETQDSIAVLEQLIHHDVALDAVVVLGEVARHLYWQKKNLAGALLFLQAGYQLGLSKAVTVEVTDPEAARKLSVMASGWLYDIASFTWAGWDEKDIPIRPEQAQLGLAASHASIRMCIQLKKNALHVGRAHWMLGAHLLAAGRHADALQSFNDAAQASTAGESEGEALLAKAFGQLACQLQGGNSTEPSSALSATLDKLKKIKDGEFFARQVTTALKVFRS